MICSVNYEIVFFDRRKWTFSDSVLLPYFYQYLTIRKEKRKKEMNGWGRVGRVFDEKINILKKKNFLKIFFEFAI